MTLNAGDVLHCANCMAKWATVTARLTGGMELRAEYFDASPHKLASGMVVACWECHTPMTLSPMDTVVITPDSEGAPEKCSCDFRSVIMVTGCQCGGT